jgi:hypothetical protein
MVFMPPRFSSATVCSKACLFVAATSVEEVRKKIELYYEASTTRVILPYVPYSSDVIDETEDFISKWN